MTALERLAVVQDAAYSIIRSSEDWAKTYKDSPKQFSTLLRIESRLQRNLRKYFKDLAAGRIEQWVDWNKYQAHTVSADEVSVSVTITEDSPQYQAEESILLGVVVDDIKDGMFQGVLGARQVYQRFIDTALVNQGITKQALQHSAQLVKGLNATTLSDVQRSIAASIKEGETLQQATKRLATVIGDPRRSELIAKTESVRSFQAGKYEYAKQTRAVTKEWIALPGADEGSAETPCVDDSSQDPIALIEDFVSGDPYPPAHPRCRCDVIFHYPDDITSTSLPDDVTIDEL